MLLTGSEVHLVLIVVHAQVYDVGQQLFVPVDHLQLLLQRLWGGKKRQMKRSKHSFHIFLLTEPWLLVLRTWPTNLGDFVVVGQEHGQILRLLDG